MNNKRETLRRIEAMLEPRHMFILPAWVDPVVLDQLLQEGYLTCIHQQRDEKGALQVIMGLELTHKGERLANPRFDLPKLALRGSLAGASFVTVSMVILYFG